MGSRNRLELSVGSAGLLEEYGSDAWISPRGAAGAGPRSGLCWAECRREAELAERYGLAHSTVIGLLRQHGVAVRYPQVTPEVAAECSYDA